MIDYYIIGKGGCAKDVLVIAKKALSENEFQFKGFIDYQPKEKSIVGLGEKIPILDEKEFLSNVLPSSKINLYMGIANSYLIQKLSVKFKNFQFPNLIHPNVTGYFPSIQLGFGNIIGAFTSFTADIQIGNFNMFNNQITIAHDIQIGNYNVFNPGANISGGISIGNSNLIGTNATILQYLTIGNNNILGAGANLLQNIKDNEVWVGNPAKKIKDNV